MSSAAHLDSLGPKLKAFFASLDASVKAALPQDFDQSVDNLANDFALTGKALVADEVAVAEAKWPAEAQLLAPVAAQFADQKIDEANAAMQAEVAKWTAVKTAAMQSALTA